MIKNHLNSFGVLMFHTDTQTNSFIQYIYVYIYKFQAQKNYNKKQRTSYTHKITFWDTNIASVFYICKIML